MTHWKKVPLEYGDFEYDGCGNVRTTSRKVKAFGWMKQLQTDGKTAVVPRYRVLPVKILHAYIKGTEKQPHFSLKWNGKVKRVKQSEFVD